MCEWLQYTEKIGDCLNWMRCVNTDGYPRAGRKGNSNLKVHREVYKETHPEEDITNKVIRHTCDNILCINPNHLLSGTPKENNNDRDSRNRQYRLMDTYTIQGTLNMLDEGISQKEIAAYYGIDSRRISDIKCGRYTIEGRLAKKGN